MKMLRRTVSGEAPPKKDLGPEWEKNVKRLPNGRVEMQVSDELSARLDELRLPGEDDNAVIVRSLKALPKDGGHRKGFRQARKGKR